MTFQVETENQGNAAVITARGELDLATVEILENEVERILGEGFNRLVIDLTEVTFMDSTGMRLLLVTAQRFDAAQGSLAVVLAGGPVERALAITGIDRMLMMYDSVAAAIS